MKRTKQIKRGLIYFTIAVVLSVANIALKHSDNNKVSSTDTQLAVVLTTNADLK